MVLRKRIINVSAFITLRLTDEELKRVFLYLVAPHENAGEQAIEITEIIALMINAAGRQE